MTTRSPAAIDRADDVPPMPRVVGAIRSGTTLLRLMPDAHSQIAMAPETAFPEELFRVATELPGEAIAARVVAQGKWPDLGLDRDAYLAVCRGRSGVEALTLVWEHYRRRQGKPIVGDKSPGYVRFLPTVTRVLPQIRVIHLVRDGRDCFASQLHSRFSLYSAAIRPPARQAAEWCEAVDAGRRDGPSLPRYLEVRYEAAAHDFAVASAAALGRREYAEASRLATRAFRADPRSTQRMRELQAVAEWQEDLAVHWRMEVAWNASADARFGGRPPAWEGEPTDATHRLFIWKSHRHLGAEVRHAAALANLGEAAAHTTVEVDPRLVPLVKRRFPALDGVPRGALPDDAVTSRATYHATWERLGHYLLPSAAAIPKEPWLEADPERVRRFARRRFSRAMRPRVGLVWHSTNTAKSLPPYEAWRALLAVTGVEFVSAQHGIDPRGVAEWRGLGERVRVEPVDLDGLAAVVRSCDLVVAISASQAHLAGALGVPTWLLVREAPILTCPLGKATTVWCPHTRCVWVADDEPWEQALRRVADELRAWRAAWVRRRIRAFFRRPN